MKSKAVFKFELYIVAGAPHSNSAIANLRELCSAYLAERHEIEIVDVQLHVERAIEQGVLITPLLVRVAPAPICKIAGNLSNRQTVVETIILLS